MSRHNDARRIADALASLDSGSNEYDGSPKLAAVTLIRRSIVFPTVSCLANGSDAVAANAVPTKHRAIANGRVLGAYFLPTVAATAHATNNAQIEVVQLQANGVPASVALAAANTAPTANGGTGNVAVGIGLSLTVASGANGRFLKGVLLAPKVSQNSGGVAMGAGSIQVDIELEGASTDYPY